MAQGEPAPQKQGSRRPARRACDESFFHAACARQTFANVRKSECRVAKLAQTSPTQKLARRGTHLQTNRYLSPKPYGACNASPNVASASPCLSFVESRLRDAKSTGPRLVEAGPPQRRTGSAAWKGTRLASRYARKGRRWWWHTLSRSTQSCSAWWALERRPQKRLYSMSRE